MKKVKLNKLVLNKRTIADLPKMDMIAVRGGTGEDPGINSKPVCHDPSIETLSMEFTCDQTGKTIPESNCTC